ncbi:hypothetical protein Niako_2753 [Niastella koreensis GR20-10]|uniref:Uncharacterized protein n=1 Tax=Niastella koreensis (strain DSM 17620 / KACC 11465 / NBRC 106392 / GR20-10) TaxID=700598 RepID=G8T8B9_NIAKG|nr:hypothetical protein Niako_2753 [Niastella koreensis GR20-10]
MVNSSLYFTSVAGLQNGAAIVGCHLVAEGLALTITRFMYMRTEDKKKKNKKNDRIEYNGKAYKHSRRCYLE